MKLLFDFFPIVLFFVVYKMHDDPHQGFIVATAVIIVATAAQVLVMWLRERRVEKMHVAVLVIVVIFGGITLALDDEIFFKWKPTVVNWLFAVVFLGSEFIGAKNIVRRLMESKVKLPDSGVDPAQRELGALLRGVRSTQSLRHLQLRHRYLGRLQAVRADGTHAGIRSRSGRVHDATYAGRKRRRRSRLMPASSVRSPGIARR